MQTFLPFADFAESVRVLDQKRLGKQRVETLQVMLRLAGLAPIWKDINPVTGKPSGADLPYDQWRLEPRLTKGWANHPVARMWRGHEYALFQYQVQTCDEWVRRGYKDTCLEKTAFVLEQSDLQVGTVPPWLGREDIHASHRGRLLAKDPEFYGQYGWTEEPISEEQGYVWPV